MIYNYYDSYGYKFPEGFITTATQRGVKFMPSKNIPQKRTEIESFFSEAGQDTVDLNQSPLLYKNKIECDEPIPKHDYSKDYFTTEALENGTIAFNIWVGMGTDLITSISYSKDNGETWTTVNNENNKEGNLQIEVNVEEGDKILWKGTAQQLGYYDEDEGDNIGSFFSSTCEFNAYGNVMSMLYGDNFSGRKTLSYDWIFTRLFGDYNEEQTCSIINASNISLPATTLAQDCYQSMFGGCTSLKTAPELPATTLAQGCYNSMFGGCTSLNYIKALFTTTPSNTYTLEWVKNVAANGTFVKSTDATWSVVGTNGVPTGWTVEDDANIE